MPQTNQQGAITKNTALAKKNDGLKGLVGRMAPEIAKALPRVITPERFTRIALTALSSNPKLASCSQNSFLGALMQAAQLGLEPNTPLGQAYLIPYGNECQFQLGYKGILDLVHRSGDISTVAAYTVHENDKFEYSYGLEPVLIHKPAMQDRGAAIAYYAYYKTRDGGFGFEVMSRDDVEKHAKRFSKAYGSGPWRDHFDEMAKKTVLKKALKYAPVKTDFARAIETDGARVLADLNDPAAELDIVYTADDGDVEEVTQPDAPAGDPILNV